MDFPKILLAVFLISVNASHVAKVPAPEYPMTKHLQKSLSRVDNVSPFKIQSENSNRLTVKNRRDVIAKKITEKLKSVFKIPHEFYYDTPALVRSRGYLVETHRVPTQDGYILELYHILGPRNFSYRTRPQNVNVALLMSSPFGSSSDFVLNEPHESLGYILADSGYDVWLGSFRGSRGGLNHTHLNADTDLRFWDFSLDELAKYDYPALINFVLEYTGRQKLFLFSYSASTIAFFMAGSPRAGIMDKLRMAVAFAPIAYVKHPSKYILAMARLMLAVERPAKKLLRGPMYRASDLLSSIVYAACNDASPFRDLCVFITTATMGGVNRGNFGKNGFAAMLSSVTSGVPVKLVAHLAQQALPPSFKMYDYGSRKANRFHYGSAAPPLYNLSDVIVPVVFCTAPNDALMSQKDLQLMMNDLPRFNTRIVPSQSDFGHLDLVFARNARHLIYDQLLEIMKQY